MNRPLVALLAAVLAFSCARAPKSPTASKTKPAGQVIGRVHIDPDEADAMPIQYAKNIVFMIDNCLKGDQSLVLVSGMANYSYGYDTDKAIQEYLALSGKASANLISKESPMIHDFERSEILAYAHGHRGDL